MTTYKYLYGLQTLVPLPENVTLDIIVADTLVEGLRNRIPDKYLEKHIREHSNKNAVHVSITSPNGQKIYYIILQTSTFNEDHPLNKYCDLGHEEVHFLISMGRLDLFENILKSLSKNINLQELDKETIAELGR